MAALSDKDLRAILGSDYLTKLAEADAASGLSLDVREARKEHQNWEDKKFAGLSAVSVGVALLAAGLITRESTFWIQAIAAVVIGAAGGAWLLYVRRRQGMLIVE